MGKITNLQKFGLNFFAMRHPSKDLIDRLNIKSWLNDLTFNDSNLVNRD